MKPPWGREAILDAIADWYDREGRLPIHPEWKRAADGRPAARTVQRYGGWLQMLAEAIDIDVEDVPAHQLLRPYRAGSGYWDLDAMVDALIAELERSGRLADVSAMGALNFGTPVGPALRPDLRELGSGSRLGRHNPAPSAESGSESYGPRPRVTRLESTLGWEGAGSPATASWFALKLGSFRTAVGRSSSGCLSSVRTSSGGCGRIRSRTAGTRVYLASMRTGQIPTAVAISHVATGAEAAASPPISRRWRSGRAESKRSPSCCSLSVPPNASANSW